MRFRPCQWVYYRMRIVSYNILDGGQGRADPLAEIILAQRPDIVGLVEAEDLVVLERIANRLGMDFIQAAGNSQASALLSRWPILETINHAPLQPQLSKSLLEATVIDPQGQIWTLGVLHLEAQATEAAEAARERELDVVLKVFESHRQASRPHLLLGDFNSNSPRQRIDPAKCKPKTQDAWRQNGGRIPRRVVQRLLDAGYHDTMEVADPRLATEDGTFSTQHPGQRVDYVFAHGIEPARIRSAWIEQDRLAQFASDHFPIGVEIV